MSVPGYADIYAQVDINPSFLKHWTKKNSLVHLKIDYFQGGKPNSVDLKLPQEAGISFRQMISSSNKPLSEIHVVLLGYKKREVSGSASSGDKGGMLQCDPETIAGPVTTEILNINIEGPRKFIKEGDFLNLPNPRDAADYMDSCRFTALIQK